MLLMNYDLYDIYSVICNIRFYSSATENEAILRVLCALIADPQKDNCIQDNLVRRALVQLKDLQTEKWDWIHIFNRYTYGMRVIREEPYYLALSQGLEELLLCVQGKNEQRIYDCADAMHNVPVIIADACDPKKDILFEIGSYSKKWNPDFYDRMKACLGGKKRKGWRG